MVANNLEAVQAVEWTQSSAHKFSVSCLVVNEPEFKSLPLHERLI